MKHAPIRALRQRKTSVVFALSDRKMRRTIGGSPNLMALQQEMAKYTLSMDLASGLMSAIQKSISSTARIIGGR